MAATDARRSCRAWLRSLLCCVLAAPALVSAQAAGLASGVYEGLMLAVAPDGHLSGFYREEQGEGVVKRCTFYLVGQSVDGQAQIQTWSDQGLPGRLTSQGASVTLTIPRGREHAGCGLVLMPEVATGLRLDRVATAQWSELRSIATERADLFKDAGGATRLRAYLVKGDVVGVVAEQVDWVKIEYVSGTHRTRGWIRAVDCSKLVPPGR